MKNIFKYTFFAVSGLLFAGALSSCEKTDAEEDKGATPVIKYARTCNINEADSLIVSASLGSKLCFVGDNLGDVQQIWFNDQKSKLNPTMVTSHTIIVDIPNNIPGEVTNIAKFITSQGITVDYPFQVSVPAPRVEKMSCEYAHEGDIVTISGAYFADDPNVPLTVAFGDAMAEIKSISQNELSVEVPAGAEPNAPLTVTSIYGAGVSSFRYMDQSGMLFDFDGLTGLTNHGWHNRPIENDGTGISGNYMLIGDGSKELSATADWNDNDFSFEYWAGAWTDPVSYPEREGVRLFDLVDFSDFNNMSLKFEVCIPSDKAWQAGAMQLIFAGTDLVSMGAAGTDVFGNAVPGCNNTFFQMSKDGGVDLARGLWQPWSQTTPYHTDGKWVTVSFPIKDFLYNIDGSGAARFLSSKEDFASFQLFIVGGGVEGVACTPLIKIDNIRAVKN